MISFGKAIAGPESYDKANITPSPIEEAGDAMSDFF
jgi:hypothetical protein